MLRGVAAGQLHTVTRAELERRLGGDTVVLDVRPLPE
jgi:hypothetical protein